MNTDRWIWHSGIPHDDFERLDYEGDNWGWLGADLGHTMPFNRAASGMGAIWRWLGYLGSGGYAKRTGEHLQAIWNGA